MSTHLRQGFSTLWRRQVGDGREWTPKVGRREKNKNIVCMSFKYEPRILDLRYASAIRSSQAVHHRSKRRERIEKVDTKKKKKLLLHETRVFVCVCVESYTTDFFAKVSLMGKDLLSWPKAICPTRCTASTWQKRYGAEREGCHTKRTNPSRSIGFPLQTNFGHFIFHDLVTSQRLILRLSR